MKKSVVVVGYGGQGGWHANHALKSDVVTLKGIYDIKEERNILSSFQEEPLDKYPTAII